MLQDYILEYYRYLAEGKAVVMQQSSACCPSCTSMCAEQYTNFGGDGIIYEATKIYCVQKYIVYIIKIRERKCKFNRALQHFSTSCMSQIDKFMFCEKVPFELLDKNDML